MPLGLPQVIEHGYWNSWFRMYSGPAPRDAVLVTLDNGSASFATPTARQAQLVAAIDRGGARQIFLDFPAEAGSNAAGDAALKQAIADAGTRISLVNRARTVSVSASGAGELQPQHFVPPVGTRVAASSWIVDFAGYFQKSPAQVRMGNQVMPTVTALRDGNEFRDSGTIYPAFRFDPDSVPVFDVDQILRGRLKPDTFANRIVFITRTNRNLDTVVGYFGHRRVPSALADIAGIYGEAQGPAIVFGSLPLLLLFAGTVLFARRFGRRWIRNTLYTCFVATTLLAPGLLMAHRIVLGPELAVFAVLIYVPMRLWQKWRERVSLTSSASGLPNIDALAQSGIAPSQDVVAASISHYAQMMASLPRELHGECARQIARRLSVAAGDAEIYDTDNGHFVWLTQPYSTDALVAQLEGLKALFSAPLIIEGRVLDTNIHFGLDRNAESRPMSRIKSAIVGSSEAQAKGKLYEEFGSKRLAEAHWELSLHARIDEALRNGDIWLAYQPQYDVRQNKVTGAETLIRWTDPERGPIPPDSFILQAERAGRIDTITYWVLEQAIEASGILAKEVGHIQLSVNLSAWMVDQPGLVRSLSDIVRRHNFDCSRLTLEVTETFSMSNRELAKRNLAAIRAMGFHLSIDDFGTGQAGLAYLAEIPSDEIKIDRSFVQSVVSSSRDRIIVNKTVQLAHALGQKVVAEGVEDLATLEALRGLGCDIAQGYYIGRPVRFDDFLVEVRSQQLFAKNIVKAC